MASVSRSARQESAKYIDFRKPLHGRVMHLDKDRAGYEEIKKEVVNCANEIVRLWNSFSKHLDLSSYAHLLDKCRDQAIAESESVAERYKKHGFESPFREKPEG
jgi:hypothetical protein